ncbi:MAG: outer membrane beta-barrel protein [Rhodospirillales bacterium]|nr:outer membrane beta-barrel protein [Rhodospirillales bacterium]
MVVLATTMSTGAAAAEDVYLRAGIGFDRPTETVFRDKNCEIEAAVPLYGCGLAPDGAPYRSVGNFGTVSALEVGIGGTVASALRIEALVEYRPSLTFGGRANFLAPERRQSVSTDLSVLSGMVVAYLDLPALGLPRLGPFDPFLGAGIGAVRVATGETRMMFPATTTIVPGARRSDFAWMATAGVASALSESMTLDLAWRYSDLGTAETGTGGGRAVWQDGSREPLMLNQAASEARLRSHGLRFSVRYVF